LDAELAHSDWTSVFSSVDIDSNVEHFNCLLSDLLDRFVPLELLLTVTLSCSCCSREGKSLTLYGDQGPIEEEVMVFGEISDLVAEREEFLERYPISTKFESSRPLKHLWRNLKDEGIRRQSDRYVFA
jgi:hypothetical protein